MNSLKIFLVPLVLFLYMSNCNAKSPQPSTETNGSFMASVPVKAATPIVAYCGNAVPELKAELDNEFIVYKQKFATAMEAILNSLKSDPSFSEPVTDETRNEYQKMFDIMLANVKKVDPNMYCPSMLTKLKSTSVNDLRSTIENTLAKYQVSAKNK